MILIDLYQELKNELSTELKMQGFSKSGSNFYIKKFGNWGLLSFQKNRHSSRQHIEFTIEIGVCSEKLINFLSPRIFKTKPNIENCHWRERVGFLMDVQKDYWWEINELTDSEMLKVEIRDVVFNKAVPVLLENISDESLERNWLEGMSGGLTEFERLVYLTSLLKLYDRPNLKEMAMALKIYSIEKPVEDTAESHIRKLGVKL